MTVQRLKKAVLLLFYRNPLNTVALNLFGHTLLEFLQKSRCEEMFGNEKLFKPLEDLDSATDADTKGKYTVVCKQATTVKMNELTDTAELERIIDTLHTEISGIVSEGCCVANSIKVGVNQMTSTNDGVLDIFILYIRCENE